MKRAIVDTDILSMYFRGNKNVEDKFEQYAEEHGNLNISIITYYETVSGLKYKDANKQLDTFLKFARENTVLPVTEDSAAISAEIYSRLRQSGNLIGDMDLLIAGTAISNNLIVATNNENHFGRIEELEIENWSKMSK